MIIHKAASWAYFSTYNWYFGVIMALTAHLMVAICSSCGQQPVSRDLVTSFDRDGLLQLSTIQQWDVDAKKSWINGGRIGSVIRDVNLYPPMIVSKKRFVCKKLNPFHPVVYYFYCPSWDYLKLPAGQYTPFPGAPKCQIGSSNDISQYIPMFVGSKTSIFHEISLLHMIGPSISWYGSKSLVSCIHVKLLVFLYHHFPMIVAYNAEVSHQFFWQLPSTSNNRIDHLKKKYIYIT